MSDIPGNVFPRRLDIPLPMAAGAQGAHITDDQGNRYLDASGGPLVTNVGHGREEVARAVYDQILRLDYVHATMFTARPIETLAGRIAEKAPQGIERFYFLSGGAEAVETAIKVARQIHLSEGRSGKVHLISRWKSYHGLTLGALSATGRATFRAPYLPLLSETSHIPAPYCYRCDFGLTYPGCGIRCALELESTIKEAGPDTVSAFLAETVSGATIAAVVPPPEYFPMVREICDRYQVLLILDEVLCGFGRTGRYFASEHFGVVPDIVTIGKGLGGGAVPISAVGVQGRYFDAMRARGGFVHGGTFTHHHVAAAAANTVLDIMEREGLVERVERLGPILAAKLKERLGGHPNVGDIRGVGFLQGVEFVKDRSTLAPFPRAEKVTERLWDNLFRRGVILYKSTGLAGIDGDAMVIGPPFNMEEKDLDRVVEALSLAVEEELG